MNIDGYSLKPKAFPVNGRKWRKICYDTEINFKQKQDYYMRTTLNLKNALKINFKVVARLICDIKHLEQQLFPLLSPALHFSSQGGSGILCG